MRMVEEDIQQQQLHINSSEEILPRLNSRTLAQLRTNKSPFIKSYLHKVDVKSHPSPLCPICNTHIHNTHTASFLQLHPHMKHIVTSGFVDKPYRSDWTAGQVDCWPGGRKTWLVDHKLKDRIVPDSKGHGSG